MMSLDRFATLADAYGADLRRWPQAEQAAARARLDRDARAQQVLAQAGALDAVLDAVPRAVATHELRERVLAAAAGAGFGRRGGRRRGPVSVLAWLSGAGWAAAGFAGVAFGMSMTWAMTADQQVDAVYYLASLSGPDDMEVLGQ